MDGAFDQVPKNLCAPPALVSIPGHEGSLVQREIPETDPPRSVHAPSAA
jgi:hypothetical protein